MGCNMSLLQELVKDLSRFPGVGRKSAQRMVYFLLEADPLYVQRLGKEIEELQDVIAPCSVCGSYSEEDPCEICEDTKRDSSIVCVVEEPQDIQTIVDSGVFSGVFHVLGGVVSPIDGIKPEDLRISQLIQRIEAGGITEVIIATNPTEGGNTTALYLHHLLKNLPVTLSRLASGIPVGGDLEYTNRTTLAHSFRGRITLD